MFLANPCGPAVLDAMQARTLGYIDTPAQGNKRPEGVTWCADNGCYSDKWDEAKWWQFLVDNAHDAATCLFAVAPDVVGDAWRSHMKSYPWLAKIKALGYPVAYVIQNGADRHPIPWHDFDVMFIGGCPECPEHGSFPKPIKMGRGGHQRFYCPNCRTEIFEWKLGPVVRALVAEAKARGKRVHMGRVNSQKRFEYARAIGCDSVDGTYLTNGADTNLPKLLAWTRAGEQDGLFDLNGAPA